MYKRIVIIFLLLCLFPYITYAAKRIRLIDLNIASADNINQIPGIDQKLAKKIVEKRVKLNYFKSIEQLREIEGIDELLYNKIKAYFTITSAEEIQTEKNLERVEEFIEESADSGDNYEDDIGDIDTLESLRLNKLNLNQVTKSQLMELPYVSPEMVSAIVRYRKENNGFKNIDELESIVGKEIFDKIKPYVAVLTKDMGEKFRGDLVIKYNMREYPLSSGYLESESKYHNPAELYSRLRIYGGNRLEFGTVMRRDDGSRDLSLYNTMNYHLMKKYMLMRNVLFWDTLVVGDYELSFGQGLILYSGGSWSTVPTKPKGLRGDREDDNNDRFYGIAGLRELPNLEMYGFYSNKSLIVDDINSDGSVADEADDIFGNKTLSYYDSYRYGNVDYLNVTLYGGRFKYFLSPTLSVGTILYKEEFDQIIDPADSDGEYEDWAYLFRGDRVEMYGFDAEYSYYNLKQYITVGKTRSHIFTRTDKDASRNWENAMGTAWESLTSLKIERFTFYLNYHYIGPEFYAFHNKPLHAIYAAKRNERGEFFGVKYKTPAIDTTFVLKYGDFIVEDLSATDKQENELDITAKLRYKPSRTVELYLYTNRGWESMEESDSTTILAENKVHVRTDYRKIQLAYMPSDAAYLKCGYYVSDAVLDELNAYYDSTTGMYPKQTLYSKVKYKPGSRLTLYGSFKYSYTADDEADIYWSINPKYKLSKYSKLYFTYKYNMTEPEQSFSLQYNCSW